MASTVGPPPQWRRDQAEPAPDPACRRAHPGRATAACRRRPAGPPASAVTGAFLAGAIAGYGVAVPVGAIAVLIAGLTARTSLRVGAAAGLGAATADGAYALIAVLGGAALATAITPIAGPLRWAAAVILLVLAAHTAWAALGKPAPRRRPVGPAPADSGSAGLGSAGLGAAGPAPGDSGSAGSTPASSALAGPAHAVPNSGSDAAGADPSGLADGRGPAGPGLAGRSPAGRGPASSSLTAPETPGRAYLAILGLTLLNPATVVYFAALVMGRGGAGGGVWFVLGAFLASASWQLLIAGGGALVGRVLTGERGRLITSLVSSVVIAILAVVLIA